MGVLLALAAAAVYGTGDFFGGVSAKRGSLWAVVVVSQAIGGLAMLVAALESGQARLSPGAYALAACGGVAGGAGITLLYRGLAVGRMGVVAPVTGVVSVGLPVMVGVLRGDRAAWSVWLGVALAVAAVALISTGREERLPCGAGRASASGLREALGAGCGFGLLYVLFAGLGDASPLWTTVAARSASVPVLILAAWLARGSLRPEPRSIGTIALAGICDAGANALYLLSLRQALLSVAAVVTSLYPASTVLLARFALHERLSKLQWIGILCGGVAVALIAARGGG